MLELATRAYGEQHPDFARLLTQKLRKNPTCRTRLESTDRADAIAHDGAMDPMMSGFLARTVIAP
jgi:hypothetical protein